MDPLVPEDLNHPTLFFEWSIPNEKLSKLKPSEVPSYNFSKANFLQIYYSLRDIDWQILKNYSDVDHAVSKFYEIIYDSLNKNVPNIEKVEQISSLVQQGIN